VNTHWRVTHGKAKNRSETPTIAEAIAHFEANPNLAEAVKVGKRVADRLRVAPSVCGTAWYMFSELDDSDANAFIDAIVSGIGLEERSPLLVLRRVYEKNQLQARPLDSPQLLAITIKAWNAWRKGRKVELLAFKMGGVNPEAWPEPV
jgi:hypothetical protein